jgi:capsular polysaccharide transport system permease protein
MVAIGFGVIHCVMSTMFKWWENVWQIVYRFLYFASGIFYVTSNMPEWLVRILAWNPVMHCIAWYRGGFFDTYSPVWLNRTYPLEFAVALLVVGLTMEIVLRRRLQNPL